MIKQSHSEILARDENDHEHRLSDPGRRRPEDLDRHVGARLRERRIMPGLSQQQLADLIGVTFQQAYKYERGINRVTSGRLYKIAQALDVDIGYFFERTGTDDAPRPTQRQRLLLEFMRDFMAIPDRKYQEEILLLARVLAEADTRPHRSGETAPRSEGRRTARANAPIVR
jgi:transcriptional regulator with XRE-family HTH domain